MEEQDIHINGYLSPALGEALLLIPPEERDKVAVLVDVGYLSTEVMFVQGDALIRHEVLPMGGGHLAADLAMELSITMDMAEELKRKYTFGIGQDQLSVTDPDGQNVSFPRETVLAVIEPRVAELSDMVRDTIEKYASELSQRSTFYITGRRPDPDARRQGDHLLRRRAHLQGAHAARHQAQFAGLFLGDRAAGAGL